MHCQEVIRDGTVHADMIFLLIGALVVLALCLLPRKAMDFGLLAAWLLLALGALLEPILLLLG